MSKYRFKDGFECEALNSEEAKAMHKAFKDNKTTASAEATKDNLMNNIWKAQSNVESFEEYLEKCIQALDHIKSKEIPIENVKKYLDSIKDNFENCEFGELMKNIEDLSKTLTSKPSNMKEWKELCLELLPDSTSLGDAQRVEEKLEEVCH